MHGWVRLAMLGGILVASPVLRSQDVVLSEIQAANSSTIRDADGEFSDWIELYNGGETSVNLQGWALTDNQEELSKWVFPTLELRSREFLIVFASGEDRRDASAELHANFKLSRSGEFLALVRPDRSIASSFTPEYPEQQVNASFGSVMEHLGVEVVPATGDGRYIALPTNVLGESWVELGFDDARWLDARMPLGYDGKGPPTFANLVQTNVETEVRTLSPTVAVRLPFALESTASVEALRLTMKYEAGFVAYINGIEVARRNVGPDLSVLGPRAVELVPVPEVIPLRIVPGVLQDGDNVLAILGFNDTIDSADFLMGPLLEVSTNVLLGDEAPRFFAVATPGWPNVGLGGEGFAKAPAFSSPGTAFTGSFSLEISSPAESAEIRYTTDGTEPRLLSALYTEPLQLTRVTRVRARAFEPDLLPSPMVDETYVAFDPEVFAHDSDLPLVVITSFDGPVGGAWRSMQIQVIDRQADGRTVLDAPRHHSSLGAIKTRGSSTGGRERASYSVEFQDETGVDREAEILGMAKDSDWVLYAAFNFDRALLRNPFVYELSRRTVRWATDSRFCEVFLYTAGDVIGPGDYRGVYSFMEKINRSGDRVDIEKLELSDNQEPEVTGGYIFKVDRLDPGDVGFAGGGQRFAHVYPRRRT
jgi:hypothetical protein